MPPKKNTKTCVQKIRYRRRRQITERLLIGCGAVLSCCLIIWSVAVLHAKMIPLKQTLQRNHRMRLLPQMQPHTNTDHGSGIPDRQCHVGDCTLGTDENFDYDTSLVMLNMEQIISSQREETFSADDLTIANFEGTLTDSEDREDRSMPSRLLLNMPAFHTSGSVEAVLFCQQPQPRLWKSGL